MLFRIARLLLDEGWRGIDSDYAERELEFDRTANGARNFTIDSRSGLAPASAFRGLFISDPPTQWTPQYSGHDCLSRYPLRHCPFPGLCAPAAPEHAADSAQPCAVWRSGEVHSLKRAIDSGMPTLRRDERATRVGTQNFDSPGRWLDHLWHPCAYVSDFWYP